MILEIIEKEFIGKVNIDDEIVESDDQLVVTYDPDFSESDRKFSIMTSSFGESSMFSTDDIDQLREIRDMLSNIIKEELEKVPKEEVKGRTFEEWNDIGYYVVKGSKAKFDNGKFLFDENQVKKKGE